MLLTATLVVFLLAFGSVRADLIAGDNYPPRYEHILSNPEIGITIAIVMTSEKYYDFPDFNQDIMPYIHTVNDTFTGETWIYSGVDEDTKKIAEPGTWLLIISGIFLISIFVITRRT